MLGQPAGQDDDARLAVHWIANGVRGCSYLLKQGLQQWIISVTDLFLCAGPRLCPAILLPHGMLEHARQHMVYISMMPCVLTP